MPDNVVSFPLRGATLQQLATALGRCHAEYQAWHQQAVVLHQFVDHAREAGVRSVLKTRFHELMHFARENSLLTAPIEAVVPMAAMEAKFVDDQLTSARHGTTLAAVVIIHTSTEILYWRLLRFGLIANRDKMLKRFEERKITVKELRDLGSDGANDAVLENWWDKKERESLLDKWDNLIGEFGMPDNIRTDEFALTREMLAEFDEMRHNAVHHDASSLRKFALREFAAQLSRAHSVIVMHVAHKMALQLSFQSFFLGQ